METKLTPILLMLFVIGTSARAQEPAEALAGFDFVDVFVQPQPNQQQTGTDEQRLRMQRYLLVRVEHVVRVCDLSAKQAKKLEVAAKRAAQLTAGTTQPQQQGVVQMPQFARGFRVANDAIAVQQRAQVELMLRQLNVRAQQPVVVDGGKWEIAVRDPNQVNWARVVNGAVANVDAKAAGQPIWQKTIERVLSPEQKQEYEAAKKRLAQPPGELPVDNVVRQIDLELFLSDEQRASFAEQISLAMKRHSAAGGQITGFGLPHAYQQVPESELQGLLSDAQMGRWRDLKRWSASVNVRVMRWDDNVRVRQLEQIKILRDAIQIQK